MCIPPESLAGKTALVTGAGSGIGRAAAIALARAGAAVALVGTTLEKLQAVAAEIRQGGGVALPIRADVAKAGDMQTVAATCQEQWGHLHILHHNAGINGVWAPFEDFKETEWDATLSTNLKGTFLSLKHCFPLLQPQGGSVIITSSVNGTRMFSNAGASVYASTKAAQLALAKMLALEWARHRIRVNVICPGSIDTAIHQETQERHLDRIRVPAEFPEGSIPLTQGRSGSPEEVAQLVWFLASDLSSHITGTEVYIDGGQSLIEG